MTLQLLILGTGNYTFFNYLTMVLSLSCFDDGCLGFSASNTVAVESVVRDSDTKSSPPAMAETPQKTDKESKSEKTGSPAKEAANGPSSLADGDEKCQTNVDAGISDSRSWRNILSASDFELVLYSCET